MSDVENQLRQDMNRALSALAKAAQHAGELIAAYVPKPEPVKAKQPDRFEYRDSDGDRVLVYPHDYPEFESVLMVETDADSVRLSQDAVNGLAQYLDRYRTDVPCPKIVGIPEGEECAGTQHHDGPCSPDADQIGAPVRPQPPECCGHLKVNHGPYGCKILPCTCRCGTSL